MKKKCGPLKSLLLSFQLMSVPQLNADATYVEDEGTLFARDTTRPDADDSYHSTAEADDELLFDSDVDSQEKQRRKR